jgi:hypothetical protein
LLVVAASKAEKGDDAPDRSIITDGRDDGEASAR